MKLINLLPAGRTIKLLPPELAESGVRFDEHGRPYRLHRGRRIPVVSGGATCLLYSAATGGDVALSAATAKTVLNVIAASGRIVEITEIGVGFDNTVTTNEAVVVELCKSTQATAGTSTSVTPTQIVGPTVAVAATAAKNYTAEPTVLTAIQEWQIEPKSGQLIEQFPLGEQIVSDVAKAVALRCTAPNAVNARAYLKFRE